MRPLVRKAVASNQGPRIGSACPRTRSASARSRAANDGPSPVTSHPSLDSAVTSAELARRSRSRIAVAVRRRTLHTSQASNPLAMRVHAPAGDRSGQTETPKARNEPARDYCSR